MEVVVLLLVGLTVGALGRAVVPGRQLLPLWLTTVIGVTSLLLVRLLPVSLLVEVVVGALVAAVLIAVSQSAVRSRTRT